MKPIHALTTCICAFGALWGTAGAQPAEFAVSVAFGGDPARYIDARLDGYGGEKAEKRVQEALRAHLQALGDEKFAEGQRLEIEILDIDLAGRFEPWHFHLQDTRIMRDVTWPSIHLRYTLRGPQGEIASGKETISDMDYLSHSPFLPEHDRLRYEKRMLSDWFRARFVDQVPGRTAATDV